jgi:tetratricopeptide (TPR) repeat protein
MFKQLEHDHGAAATLVNAGRLAEKQGEWETAVSLLEEGLGLKQELGDERGMAVALCGLGDAALGQNQLEVAKSYLAQGLTLANESGDVTLVLEALAIQARLHFAQGNHREAVRRLAFVLSHEGTAQEVREGAAALRQEFGKEEWETAVAWASRQTLADLVAAAAADSH